MHYMNWCSNAFFEKEKKQAITHCVMALHFNKLTKVGHALRKSLLLLPLFFSVGGSLFTNVVQKHYDPKWPRSCSWPMTKVVVNKDTWVFFMVFKTMAQFNYSCTIIFVLHWNNKYYCFFIMSHVICKCQYLIYQRLFYFIFKFLMLHHMGPSQERFSIKWQQVSTTYAKRLKSWYKKCGPF